MVEFYASIGSNTGVVDAVAERVDRIEREISRPIVSAGVRADGHWIDVTSNEDVTALVAGTVFSVRQDDGDYRSVVGERTADVFLRRYRDGGVDSLAGLNGEFVAIIADDDADRTVVVTDRLGALPGFLVETGDGTRVTTNVQLLADDDTVDLEFDLDYLTEFFVFQRTFGIRTPLKNVEKLPPASVLVFDDDGTYPRRDSYWEPVYAPSNRNYSYFVEEFADRISTVMRERSEMPGTSGLLLSGGSDSRLLAHLLDDGSTAYHMNDNENQEVKVARRIATHTGHTLEFLRRDEEYYPDVLEADASFDNFTSWFHESHAVGFESRLADTNLVTGLFCDILFRGYYLPETHVTIPVLNKTLRLPRLGDVSPESLVDHRLSTMTYGTAPRYLRTDRSIADVLRENFQVVEDGFVDHGVHYPSIEPLYFSYYPLTNDYARDYFGTLRVGPRWSPFLDARMIDLQLEYPMDFMMEKNIINDVIDRFDPELLSIPHGESGVKLNSSRFTHELSLQVRSKVDRIRKSVGAWDVGYTERGSWQDHGYIFENNEWFDDYMYSSDVRDRLAGLEFVDLDAVYDSYESDGTYLDFYPLITLLETPVAKVVAGS